MTSMISGGGAAAAPDEHHLAVDGREAAAAVARPQPRGDALVLVAVWVEVVLRVALAEPTPRHLRPTGVEGDVGRLLLCDGGVEAGREGACGGVEDEAAPADDAQVRQRAVDLSCDPLGLARVEEERLQLGRLAGHSSRMNSSA